MSETWRLDRLVLQGFKSFADRTLLDFPDPVTGIIGPNGSGKSTLVHDVLDDRLTRLLEVSS